MVDRGKARVGRVEADNDRCGTGVGRCDTCDIVRGTELEEKVEVDADEGPGQCWADAGTVLGDVFPYK